MVDNLPATTSAALAQISELELPQPGVTPGPEWAERLNQIITLVAVGTGDVDMAVQALTEALAPAGVGFAAEGSNLIVTPLVGDPITIPMPPSTTPDDAGMAAAADGPLFKQALTAQSLGVGSTVFQDLVARLDRGVGNARWLIVSDSTAATNGAWVDQLVPLLAARFPHLTISHRKWTDGSPGAWGSPVVTTGTGSMTLHIDNASVAGKTWQYHFDASRWGPMLAANEPDAILVSLGHNDNPGSVNTGNVAPQRAKAMGYLELLRSIWPSARLVLSSQNPLNAQPLSSQYRGAMLRKLAMAMGAGFIDPCSAFLDDGRPLSVLVSSDGTHPTEAGYALWAKTVMSEFSSRASGRVQAQPTPALLVPRRNLVTDPAFAAYESGQPAGWISPSNVTPTLETTITETGGKALRLAKTNAGSVSVIEYPLPLELVRGRTVTAVFRLYIPAGNPSTAGQVVLRDQSSSPGSETWAQPDQWFWRAMTIIIPPTATLARARLMVDPTNGTSTPTVIVDRVGIGIGDTLFDPLPL